VLWPFLALSFAWFFGMGSVVSLWPVFMHNNGYTQTQISGLWALAALGEVGCLLLAGYLADRLGRKWVILAGVSIMACVYTAYTFAPAFVWFIPIQIVRSFAYSSFEAPALLYATELGLRQRRGRLAGLYYSASGLGGVAGSLLGAAAAQAFGMTTMYRSVALGMVAVALVVALVMPRLRSSRAPVTTPAAPTSERPV
jgi:MFS family permease